MVSCEACLDEEHSVDHEADIVLGDGGLIGDGDGVLLERVNVRDPVNLAHSQMSVVWGSLPLSEQGMRQRDRQWKQ